MQCPRNLKWEEDTLRHGSLYERGIRSRSESTEFHEFCGAGASQVKLAAVERNISEKKLCPAAAC